MSEWTDDILIPEFPYSRLPHPPNKFRRIPSAAPCTTAFTPDEVPLPNQDVPVSANLPVTRLQGQFEDYLRFACNSPGRGRIAQPSRSTDQNIDRRCLLSVWL